MKTPKWLDVKTPKWLDNSRQWWHSKATLRDKLLAVIGTLAILWYFVAILFVGCSNPPEEKEKKATDVRAADIRAAEMRQFMTVSISTISGTLATYLGLVLGLGQVREIQQKVTKAQHGAQQPNAASEALSVPQITPLQTIAAWTYVLSLLLALLIWAIRAKEDFDVDGVIVNLGRSILGLFGGVLAVILNVDQRGTTA